MKTIKNLVAILTVLFSFSLSAQNLLVDGGFEGLVPDALGAWAKNGDVTIDSKAEGGTNPDWVIRGNETARFAGRNSNVSLQQKVAVTVGETYAYSCVMRLCNWDGENVNGGTFTGFVAYDEAGVLTWDPILTSQSADTVFLSGEFTVPEGVDSVLVQVKKDKELLWIDDVFFGIEGGASALLEVESKQFTTVTVASKQLSLQSETPMSGYAIYTLSGQLLKQSTGLSVNQMTVDANKFQGVFIVNVMMKDGGVESHKVLIK